MKHLLPYTTLLLLLGSPHTARALVLDFEDLYPGHETTTALPPDYAGLTWQGARWITRDLVSPSGYHNTVNGHVGIFASSELAFSMGGSTFSLVALRAGAAWNDDQGVWICGYRSGALVSDNYLTVGYEAGDYNLSCLSVDAVVIIPDPTTGSDHSPTDPGRGHHVVVDDLVLETGGGQAPVADAGADQTAEQGTAAGAEVTLDGSASTGNGTLTHEWYESSELLGTGETIAVMLPLGVHAITLRVTDAAGNSDSDEVTVTVQDTISPQVSLEILKSKLWPANDAMHLCARATGVQDACDADPAVEIAVTSNEAITGPGDAEPDWESVATVDGWEIWLRAERWGSNGGRVYTITVRVADESGNVTTNQGSVTVPHDQGNGNGQK